MIKLNERIKELRKELKLTQREFAERLGVSRDTIANIEGGRIDLKDIFTLSICREFNVNETWLRTGEGEMFEELTDQEKIMKYTAMLLSDKDSAIASAIQSLIITYEQLSDSNKAVLEKIALQYLDNLKKSR